MIQNGWSSILLILGSFSLTMSDRAKIILLYTKLNANPSWYLRKVVQDEKYFEDMHCPATNCIITYNHTYLPEISDYDVIVMHSWNLPSIQKLRRQENRRSDQIYVLHFHESPTRTNATLAPYSQFFNWTMSFGLNAEVTLAYSQFVDKETNAIISPSEKPAWRTPNFRTNITKDESVITIVKSKTKFAAWFVSSCNPPSKRRYIAQKMQEYVAVDVYGKCGTLNCDRNNIRECRQMVEDDYKFYLAFENSLCSDYVTEKAFAMMKHYVIPVVYGGADYSRILPPKSYISVLDYNSVEELVDYLQFVANNEEEYLKYFWWKDYYNIMDHSFCGLCEKITRVGEKPGFVKYYTDMDYWLKNGSCVEPGTIPLVKAALDQFENSSSKLL